MSGFRNARIVKVGADPREYHQQTAERGTPGFVMSSSALREFARCPSRWKAGYLSPESQAKEWGSLLDARLLTHEQFYQRYAVLPPDAPKKPTKAQLNAKKPSEDSKAAIAWWDTWTKEHAGCEIISQDELQQCDTAIARLLSNEDVVEWHNCSDKQVWVEAEWHDDATGLVIPCRCLLDYVPRVVSVYAKCAGDLKTGRSAHPMLFEQSAFNLGYHWQASFDLDMLTAATGEDRNTWCFVVQENYEPWEPNLCMYGQETGDGMPSFLDLGRDEQFHGYREALGNYAKCLKSGRWPGYNQTDEAVAGWCVLRPRPFMAERLMFGPRYVFGADEEADVPDAETEPSVDMIP